MKKLGFRLVPRFHITSSSQRKILLVGMAIVISVIGLAAAALCIVLLGASSDFSDRLVEIGDVIAGATLILAIVAAAVALLAYTVSTGLPELRIQVDFPYSELNKPSFESTFQDSGIAEARDFKQLFCTIRVRNESGYSAKNPAIVVRLHDMAFYPGLNEMGEWIIVQAASTYGATVVQWDGGANYSIHGGSVRTLPGLYLHNLHTKPNADPYMIIEILADGYSRKVRIPLEFKKGKLSPSPGKYSNSETLWL